MALALTARDGIVQFGDVNEVPLLGLAETNVNPVGSTSLTTTFVAVDEPALVIVIVKMTLSPTFGEGLFTDLVSTRSACGVAVGVRVGVAVNVGVFDGVAVLVTVGVYVGVLDGVGVDVSVFVGVGVGVPVFVGMAVNVATLVGVGVAVSVGVEV